MKLYIDTYAMIEYLNGNRDYAKYFKGQSLVTSILNLGELYYLLLRDSGEMMADRAYLAFANYQTPITEQDVKDGMKFRLRLKAQRVNLSYADAIGYSIAQRDKARYLTGDDAFKALSGVEFVK